MIRNLLTIRAFNSYMIGAEPKQDSFLFGAETEQISRPNRQ